MSCRSCADPGPRQVASVGGSTSTGIESWYGALNSGLGSVSPPSSYVSTVKASGIPCASGSAQSQ